MTLGAIIFSFSNCKCFQSSLVRSNGFKNNCLIYGYFETELFMVITVMNHKHYPCPGM